MSSFKKVTGNVAYGLIPAPQPRVSGGSYSANIIAILTYNP